MFCVTGLKILGRVGTHIFFLEEKYNFMHFEMPFKMHKILFFQEYLKKILGFTSKSRLGRVTLNTAIFLFGLNELIRPVSYIQVVARSVST